MARALPRAPPPLIDWGFKGDLTSNARVSHLFGSEDNFGVCRVDLSSLGLLSFSSALTRATISSTCSPCYTSCFQVLHSFTPILVRSAVCRLWRYIFTSVDWDLPLKQWSAIFRYLSTKVLMDSPFFCFVARRVSIATSISSSKKRVRNSFSKSTQVLIELAGNFMNHSKATPLRVPMNK